MDITEEWGGGTALRPFEVVRMTKTWRRKRKPDRSIETGAVQIQNPGAVNYHYQYL